MRNNRVILKPMAPRYKLECAHLRLDSLYHIGICRQWVILWTEWQRLTSDVSLQLGCFCVQLCSKYSRLRNPHGIQCCQMRTIRAISRLWRNALERLGRHSLWRSCSEIERQEATEHNRMLQNDGGYSVITWILTSGTLPSLSCSSCHFGQTNRTIWCQV